MSKKEQQEYLVTFGASDLNVHSNGRITIPAHKRKGFGARTGARVDVEIEQEDGESFTSRDLKVDGQGKVTIPGRQCGKYGVEDGDDVDATFNVIEHGE